MERWVSAVAAGAAFLAALASLIASIRNARKIEQVHISINSRMDQLLAATGLAQHAAGVEQGRKDGSERK